MGLGAFLVTFNIALHAFRHATLGCLFDHQVQILILMGCYVDVV